MAAPLRVARSSAFQKSTRRTVRKRTPMPDFIEPQLATLSEATPEGPPWVHEVKFDGYRAQIRVESRKATISTRRGYDWSDRFAGVAVAAQHLPDCIIDGEAV